jgi:hypothetical protein
MALKFAPSNPADLDFHRRKWDRVCRFPDFDLVFGPDDMAHERRCCASKPNTTEVMFLRSLHELYYTRNEHFEVSSMRNFLPCRRYPHLNIPKPTLDAWKAGLHRDVWRKFDRSNTAGPFACGACSEEVGADTTYAVVRLFCGHSLHELCAAAWFKAHATCPTCAAQFETRHLSFNWKHKADMVLEPTRSTKRKREAEDQQ